MRTEKILAKYKIDLKHDRDRKLRHWRRVILLLIVFLPAVIIMIVVYVLPIDQKLFFAILDTILLIYAYYSGKFVDIFINRGKLRLFYGPLVQNKLQELVANRYTVTKDDAEMLLRPNSIIHLEDLIEDTLKDAPDFVEFGSIIKNITNRDRIRVTLIWDKRVGFYIIERQVRYQPDFTEIPATVAPKNHKWSKRLGKKTDNQ